MRVRCRSWNNSSSYSSSRGGGSGILVSSGLQLQAMETRRRVSRGASEHLKSSCSQFPALRTFSCFPRGVTIHITYAGSLHRLFVSFWERYVTLVLLHVHSLKLVGQIHAEVCDAQVGQIYAEVCDTSHIRAHSAAKFVHGVHTVQHVQFSFRLRGCLVYSLASLFFTVCIINFMLTEYLHTFDCLHV